MIKYIHIIGPAQAYQSYVSPVCSIQIEQCCKEAVLSLADYLATNSDLKLIYAQWNFERSYGEVRLSTRQYASKDGLITIVTEYVNKWTQAYDSITN